MSGYFQRMMVRSSGAATQLHPQSRLPHPSSIEKAFFDESVELAPTLMPGVTTQKRNTPSQNNTQNERRDLAADRLEPQGEMTNEPATPRKRHEPATERSDVSVHPMPPIQAREPGATMPVDQRADAAAYAEKHKPVSQAYSSRLHESGARDDFRLMASRPGAMPNAAATRPISFAGETMGGQAPATKLAQATRAGERRETTQASKSEASEVHISIGRIEISAAQAEAPTKRKPAAPRQALSLDDYLAQRGRA